MKLLLLSVFSLGSNSKEVFKIYLSPSSPCFQWGMFLGVCKDPTSVFTNGFSLYNIRLYQPSFPQSRENIIFMSYPSANVNKAPLTYPDTVSSQQHMKPMLEANNLFPHPIIFFSLRVMSVDKVGKKKGVGFKDEG